MNSYILSSIKKNIVCVEIPLKYLINYRKFGLPLSEDVWSSREIAITAWCNIHKLPKGLWNNMSFVVYILTCLSISMVRRLTQSLVSSLKREYFRKRKHNLAATKCYIWIKNDIKRGENATHLIILKEKGIISLLDRTFVFLFCLNI